MIERICIECGTLIPRYRSKRAKTCSVACSNKRSTTNSKKRKNIIINSSGRQNAISIRMEIPDNCDIGGGSVNCRFHEINKK